MWKKLLYIRQDYPDNHVDVTFLEEMQKNVNVRSYDYWAVVRESGVIVQHMSSIVLFIAVFIYLYDDTLSPSSLISAGTALTGAGYVFWDLSIRTTDPSYEYKRQKAAKGALLFFMTLLGVSPILKTLTKDTSSDSIWALTVCLFLANLLFHDYGSSNRTNITFPGSFSLNAAIFASVLLASRLSSNMHVFSLLAFAVEWFALFPILRRHFKSLSFHYHIVLTLALFVAVNASFWHISKTVVTIYTFTVSFITFGCPFWLIWIQRYKNEIHGPWDEARPKLTRSPRPHDD